MSDTLLIIQQSSSRWSRKRIGRAQVGCLQPLYDSGLLLVAITFFYGCDQRICIRFEVEMHIYSRTRIVVRRALYSVAEDIDFSEWQENANGKILPLILARVADKERAVLHIDNNKVFLQMPWHVRESAQHNSPECTGLGHFLELMKELISAGCIAGSGTQRQWQRKNLGVPCRSAWQQCRYSTAITASPGPATMHSSA